LFYRKCVTPFFDNVDCRQVFLGFTGQGNALFITNDPPTAIVKKATYFVKTKKVKITAENIVDSVIYGDLTPDSLESLSLIANSLFMPVLSETDAQDAAKKEVLSQFTKLLSNIYVTMGQTKGKTLLPLPPKKSTENIDILDKEKVHVLETALVTWTGQIKVRGVRYTGCCEKYVKPFFY